MRKYILDFDRRIPELESRDRWETAIGITLQQWNEHPNKIEHLVCAGAQLWYTLLVMEYYKAAPYFPDNLEFVPDEFLQDNLMKATRYGFTYFSGSPVFNAYFGYMIYVMPHFFLDYDGNYTEWQSKGIDMMRYSYALDPDCPFTKALNYLSENIEPNIHFKNACKEMWALISPLQWGNSEVQQYFFRIFRGDSFYPHAYS